MTDLLSLGIWIVKNIFRIYFTVFLNCLVLFVCFIFAFFFFVTTKVIMIWRSKWSQATCLRLLLVLWPAVQKETFNYSFDTFFQILIIFSRVYQFKKKSQAKDLLNKLAPELRTLNNIVTGIVKIGLLLKPVYKTSHAFICLMHKLLFWIKSYY